MEPEVRTPALSPMDARAEMVAREVEIEATPGVVLRLASDWLVGRLDGGPPSRGALAGAGRSA